MNNTVSVKKYVRTIVVVIILIVVLSVVFSSFYTVRENEWACVVRFSQVISTTESAGLHFKVPFIDDVKFYPKMKLLYDLNPSDVLTSDSKAMSVDSFIIWQIIDPLKFYKALQTVYNAEDRLNNLAYSVLKVVVGRTEQMAIVSPVDEQSRDKINQEVFRELKGMTGDYGIEIIDIKVKRFELPTDNEQGVFRRMISDRNKISEGYRADGRKESDIIRNRVDKDVNIIKSNAEAEAEKIIAEGEAEYMQILADAYNTPERRDFYIFMRGLDALKASLSGGDKTVILDKESDLAKLLIKP